MKSFTLAIKKNLFRIDKVERFASWLAGFFWQVFCRIFVVGFFRQDLFLGRIYIWGEDLFLGRIDFWAGFIFGED